MCEVADYCLDIEILLLRGDQMVQAYIDVQMRDMDENAKEKAHVNPIFEKRHYQVDFSGGKITELTTNDVADSMYTQCDVDSNEYLHLDSLIDYKGDGVRSR